MSDNISTETQEKGNQSLPIFVKEYTSIGTINEGGNFSIDA